MNTIEELRTYFGQDHFAFAQGIEIADVQPDFATCTVALRKTHLNALGVVQGGMVFTLADFAFAVDSNSQQYGCVTVNSSINFLRAASGSRMDATARQISRSKRICVYEVSVYDENSETVATATMTGYIKTLKNGKG